MYPLGTLINGEPILKLPPKSIFLEKLDFSEEERQFYLRLEAESREQFKVFAAWKSIPISLFDGRAGFQVFKYCWIVNLYSKMVIFL